MATYTVRVDDNFRYQDEQARGTHGRFDTIDAADAACKAIVDQWLEANLATAKSAADLYDSYRSFGDDPFVVSSEPKSSPEPVFRAWEYAKARSAVLFARRDET